jgi:oxygen-independent coproporphyrinogen-3 oxidase
MNEPIALFVFIPFCKIKCTYCDFNAYANLSRWMEPYADAVVREIRNSKFGIQNSQFAKTIYFGGGTPSLLPVSAIEKILRAFYDSFVLVPNSEITLEANPGNVDADKLRELRSIGINRLSLGVQSFDDAVLRRLNRGHTVADAIKTFDDARRAGFDNVSLDFIYGLPMQTLDDWRVTLERAIALHPEHLSLYALKVEEGTGLEHQIKRGKYPMPDNDLEADMYELAEEMLDVAGYEQYEVSNWKLDSVSLISNFQSLTSNLQSPIPNYQSQHNLTYWRNQPYLGFGAGAHSCFGGERFWNVLSPIEYIQRIEHGVRVVDGREQINRELEMAETIILGLRLNEGIEFDAFAERYGEDARDRYAQQLEEIKNLGLIEFDRPEGFGKPFGSRVCLTPRGRLLSNEVFWRFLPD